MSLPASQQRALDAIDTDLRGADIRLASMFTVFTELTQLEKMPMTETFQPVRWWTRLGPIVLVPLLLAATLSLLLLSVVTTRAASSGRCPRAASFIAPVRLAAAGGCAPGGQPRSGPAGG
jgi:hypothetical protein